MKTQLLTAFLVVLLLCSSLIVLCESVTSNENAWVDCTCICCGSDMYEKIENRERFLLRSGKEQDRSTLVRNYHFNHHTFEVIEKGDVISNILRALSRK